MATAPLALRLARRELRAGLHGFRVFLACIALGVAAIAGVGSLSSALIGGLRADGQSLLGGDVELRLTHRPADNLQRAYLDNAGHAIEIIELRSMARADNDRRSLVEVKGVPADYPLYGTLSVQGGGVPSVLLQGAEGRPGALAEASLLARLRIGVGEDIRVGETTYRIMGVIEHEPDRGANAFVLGPRLMVARDSLQATGLIREGSLIRYRYRVALPQGQSVEPWLGQLNAAFPNAGWRIRDVRNGAPGLRRFVDRMRLFLTLVGLTALLVGGLGVANAVKGYLDGKTGTIATLKCLGAPAGLVFRLYLLLVMLLACVGIVIGLLVGGLTPMLLSGLLRAYLPFDAAIGIYWQPLALAATFGLLTAFAFAVWPLARAREVPAGALFRDLAAPTGGLPKWRYVALTGSALAALAALAVLSAEQKIFAIWFVVGAAAAMLAFLATGQGIVALARRLPRPRAAVVRLALANLHRPGAATVSVVLSFGLGLSVLVAVGSLQGNISQQISGRLPDSAPAFFFIDILPDQIERFARIAHDIPGVGDIQKMPSMRSRIVRVNGVPAEQIKPGPDAAWALRGDRALTYAASPPLNTTITAGDWWPRDYSGPPMISLDENVARGLGLEIGDSLTMNVLGREITARIANFREIDWSTLGINFVIIFAPGALEAAPHTFIATAEASPEAEIPLQTAVTDAFANVTAIRIREVLESANKILENIGVAVRGTAMITLVAGVLVLAGAMAAGHRRRVYESVVLKVLGATRARVLATHLIEYAILGLVTAALAAVIGTVAAWLVVTEVLGANWIFLPTTVAATAALSLALTVGTGLAGTWAALRQRPAPLLRNE